ncbi:MAG: 4-(cytidine 5'-diphospho)-2-C-methyl-D-erythritol kinase [Sphaerochaetaceae bacterium]|nr:4-(cytidine 5'-diphospho)-2-C-methyl-D-erythritol kinase [Sphaerochaetaceae bacterium]
MEVTLKAYPKVNIGLYVGKKREDGYHEISSLFQKVKNMHDTVKVSVSSSSVVSVSVTGLDSYVEEKKSTVYKAAVSFLEYCNLTGSVSISVEKHIPAKAGLGGGSSDAASVILALDKIFETSLSVSSLSEIALKVGSDVPFFVYGCTLAYVTGRGEIVKPLKERKDLRFEITIPEGSGVSTAYAYSVLDKRTDLPSLPSCEELYSMYLSPFEKWSFKNDFEIINDMSGCSEGLFLSGSGSARYSVQVD